MTCIIGLVDGGKVYMGGDRCGVDGWRRFTYSGPKVFKDNDMLIGVSGTRRLTDLLRYSLEVDSYQGGDSYNYLVNKFVPSVRKLLTDNGVVGKEGHEDKFEGGALIGFRGGLYTLYGNFQIGWYERDFDAIGSGAPFALGAMQVLMESGRGKPETMLRLALGTAEALCVDVCAPFDILEV